MRALTAFPVVVAGLAAAADPARPARCVPWECIGLFDLLDRFERELGAPRRTPQATR